MPARAWRPSRALTRSCCRAASSRTGACSSARSALLGEAGLRVLTPELLPPNDGGIAYGQLGGRRGPLARGGGIRCSGLTSWIAELASGGGARAGARRGAAARAAPRLRPRPPRRRLDADRLGPRRRHAARRSPGLAWGLGHALTLALFGLPIVLVRAPTCPDGVQRAAEALVGLMIMFLARAAAAALARAATSTRTRTATGTWSTVTCIPHADRARTRIRTLTRTSIGRGAPRALAAAGVRDRPGSRHGRLGRRRRAAAGDHPGRVRCARGAGRARARHRALDGPAVVGCSATRSRADRCSRRWLALAPAMGFVDARLRGLVRARRGRRGPLRPMTAGADNAAEILGRAGLRRADARSRSASSAARRSRSAPPSCAARPAGARPPGSHRWRRRGASWRG